MDSLSQKVNLEAASAPEDNQSRNWVFAKGPWKSVRGQCTPARGFSRILPPLAPRPLPPFPSWKAWVNLASSGVHPCSSLGSPPTGRGMYRLGQSSSGHGPVRPRILHGLSDTVCRVLAVRVTQADAGVVDHMFLRAGQPAEGNGAKCTRTFRVPLSRMATPGVELVGSALVQGPGEEEPRRSGKEL